jgi:hypothetical protein
MRCIVLKQPPPVCTALTRRSKGSGMGLRAIILGIGFAAGFLGAPAMACTLSINNGGVIALSMDGALLGSEQPSGVTAALAIASLSAATVEVGAPTLVETPAGYNGTSDVVEVRYLGLGGLSGILQDYTDQATSFAVGILPLSTLLLDARVFNPNSFEAGTYRLRTVVTCY